ncbi:MAG: ATP-binding cassette domain-containing protein [Rhodospirillales bacterium]|nr:ATP-binding cassette domain-containing protein [Rhodospirillales bacterium]
MGDSATAALKVSGLNTFYGKKQILRNVSFDLMKSEIVAVIGHNGSGKSTLLKSIYGIIPFESGGIEVFGETLDTPNPAECLKRGLAYLPQDDPVFNSLTVEENLRISMGRRSAGGVTSLLSGDGSWASWLKNLAGRPARNLSGGEKQRVALSSVLTTSAKILLLDEPTAGLDVGNSKTILEMIKQFSERHQFSVLLVEQNVRQALETAERAIILKQGEVTYSGPTGPMMEPHRMKELYL